MVSVEFEEVVGGGDQLPFAPAGGSAAAMEASHLAVELQLAEYGLDRGLTPAVERAAVRGGEHASHEVIEPARPARARPAAQAGVGCDQHLNAVADNGLDLALMPVAGIGKHDIEIADLNAAKLAARTIGSRWPKSGESVVRSAAMTTCCSLTANWAL